MNPELKEIEYFKFPDNVYQLVTEHVRKAIHRVADMNDSPDSIAIAMPTWFLEVIKYIAFQLRYHYIGGLPTAKRNPLVVEKMFDCNIYPAPDYAITVYPIFKKPTRDKDVEIVKIDLSEFEDKGTCRPFLSLPFHPD